MSFKRATVTISPILYDKNTNGEYLFDTDGDTIVINEDKQDISPSSDYDVKITIQEY